MDALDMAVEELRESFPGKSRSWVRRALTRFVRGTVRELGLNAWVVRGLPELGDRYPTYVVRLVGDRYVCTCFESAWGLRRRAEVCTHIAAVMLYRRYARLTGTVYATVKTVECTDYLLEVLGDARGRVRVVRRIEVVGGDKLNPRHRITYVIYGDEPMTVRARLVCDGAVEELELELKPTQRFVVELLTGGLKDQPLNQNAEG